MEARYFKHFDTMEVELIKGPWENKIISQITYRRSSIGPLPFYYCQNVCLNLSKHFELSSQSLDRVTSEDIENMLESVSQNLRVGDHGSASDTKRQYLQGRETFWPNRFL